MKVQNFQNTEIKAGGQGAAGPPVGPGQRPVQGPRGPEAPGSSRNKAFYKHLSKPFLTLNQSNLCCIFMIFLAAFVNIHKTSDKNIPQNLNSCSLINNSFNSVTHSIKVKKKEEKIVYEHVDYRQTTKVRAHKIK